MLPLPPSLSAVVSAYAKMTREDCLRMLLATDDYVVVQSPYGLKFELWCVPDDHVRCCVFMLRFALVSIATLVSAFENKKLIELFADMSSFDSNVNIGLCKGFQLLLASVEETIS